MSQAIQIAIMTAHYFGGDYGRHVTNCSVSGIPLNCTFFPRNDKPYLGDRNADAALADAVWWHGPHACLLPVRSCLPQFCIALISDSRGKLV